MPIADIEYNSLIERLREHSANLVEKYDDRNTIIGNIGEKFVGYCVCHVLWRLGRPINFQNSPGTYTIESRFGADNEGRGGIDFKLILVDLNEIRHGLLIECKNWGQHYDITPDMFSTQILNRFTRIDRDIEYNWFITMNVSKIEDIDFNCREHNIRILPLNTQITPDNIQSDEIMRPILDNFIDRFTSIILDISPQGTHPEVIIDGEGPKWRYIMRDLFLSVPTPIIEHRYNCSRKTISNIASYIRGFLPNFPDRRTKDWRAIWELQE